ncbi:MAG: hypothetical protein RLZZ283_78 [Candidatus Parcubacteria bacterium]|jgi:hypothetical protein
MQKINDRERVARALVLRQVVAKEAKKHQHVALDIEFSPDKESGERARIKSRFFKPAHEGAAWSEPHEMQMLVKLTPEGFPLVTTESVRRVPEKHGGVKEHIGVRERGTPHHSKL